MNSFVTFDFQQAKAKHLLFKSRLRAILYDELSGQESTVLSQYACELGQWIYSHALVHYESIPEVYALEQAHTSIHVIARNLVRRYQEGQVVEARQGLSEMEAVADQLIGLLQVVEEKVMNSGSVPMSSPTESTPNEVSMLTTLLTRNELLDTKIKNQVESEKRAYVEIDHERRNLYSFFMQAPAAHCILRGPTHIFELANPAYQELIGGRNPVGKTVREALPELAGQGFFELLDSVFASGNPFVGKEMPVVLNNIHKEPQNAYLNFIYQPIKNEREETEGILVFAYEVTEQVTTRKTLEESEARFRYLIEEAPFPTALYKGRELIIETANEAMIRVWGKDASVIGVPLPVALPELQGQPFLQILDNVFTTGVAYHRQDAKADLVVDGQLRSFYFNFTYKPLKNEQGEVYAIVNMAVDVTEQVEAREQLRESELFARSVIDSSPVAKLVIVGKELIVRTANENMLALLGRDRSIIDVPLAEAVPELVNMATWERLQHVFTTGEPYFQPEEKIEILKSETPYTAYYNYIYKPLYNTADEIYGIIVTATEVTEQVIARKKVEEAEESMRGAIELAELGTWQIDFSTGILDYSNRLREWFGIPQDEIITISRAYQLIRKADRPLVKAAIAHAITPGTNGIYDVEYTIDAAHTGIERILHAQGKAFYDEETAAYKISGTVQDVTEQRKAQLALEQQVQQRTEELAATNEELATTNEELAAANEELAESIEELAESNQLLTRSNENLQQFAYIASHDLQEPLRKIQQFGDLLKTRYATSSGEELMYIERMQGAASRMSLLIKDLLAFSRISTRQAVASKVSLTQVVDQAIENLSVAIEETNAHIHVDNLPTVWGDASQLGQLFQNLLSNAIKFSRVDRNGVSLIPQIRIRTSEVRAIDLPASVKPTRQATSYYQIEVADNGIGFEEKYVDRIFQVFQRLHGKNEFAGTGVGLAICQKVVENHGGAIIATSKPGMGATFYVYLPA